VEATLRNLPGLAEADREYMIKLLRTFLDKP
jgi:hypothetical protein